MNFFTIDLRKLILLLVFAGIPLVSINVQRHPGEPPWFLQPFSLITGVVQRSYSHFSSEVRSTLAIYLNLVEIKKNNRVLLQTNDQLRAQLGDLNELKLENIRLIKLLNFQSKSKMSLLPTKVIGRDLITNHSTLTINRGSQHGIVKLMAAIAVGGVVGYVTDVGPVSSQILLLTDRYASIDAIVQRSRSRGILEGDSKSSCRLGFLKRGDDVIEGDMIVTSGLDHLFPKGFPIGKVTNVTKDRYGIGQIVEVEPAINPFNLEELFIVLKTNQPKIEIKEPEEEPQAASEPSELSLPNRHDVHISLPFPSIKKKYGDFSFKFSPSTNNHSAHFSDSYKKTYLYSDLVGLFAASKSQHLAEDLTNKTLNIDPIGQTKNRGLL